MNSLVKALRAYHMYLPNNPIYQRATEISAQPSAPIWEAMDELIVTVAETDFVWEEQVVYHSPIRVKAWPGGCSRMACARSPSAAARRVRSCRGSSS